MLEIGLFKIISIGLMFGLGLTMDACAVSMANGLEDKNMKKNKMLFIALMFGFFQGFMPLIGYLFGNFLYTHLTFIEKYKLIPVTALLILVFLGVKMILDSTNEDNKDENEIRTLTFKVIFIQAIATSIDALSTGITFSDYKLSYALIIILLIMIVTFIASYISIIIGKKFGSVLENKALLAGGIILILIGLEIFLTGII